MRGRAARRIAAALAVGALAGGAAPAAAQDLRGDAAAEAHAIAQPWPDLQDEDGRFTDYTSATGRNSYARYGESALGYALLQTGLRENSSRLIRAGLRGVSAAVARPEEQANYPSVFETYAVAAAYNLARDRVPTHPDFVARRAEWEAWLMRVKPVFLMSTRRYFNKYLVEAVSWLELLRTGLQSSDPKTVLGDPAHARALATAFVNKTVPRTVDQARRRSHGEDAAMLSDPPQNPPAYHALSAGFYARAIELLGPDVASAARGALRRVVQASAMLQAPDGALGYWGRSQEQAWTLPMTAHAAQLAAALPGTGQKRVAEFQTTGAAALARLGATYPVFGVGQALTPALGRDRDAGLLGLDRYAGAAAYNGLTLIALGWMAETQTVPPVGTAAAAGPQGGAVIEADNSDFSVSRTATSWFAVKQGQTPGVRDDLRYDVGLVAAKVLRDGAWRDLVPLRPISHTGRTESAGPLLLRGGRTGIPVGVRSSVTKRGSVLVGGGWRTSDRKWLRRGVTFRWTPVPCGVRLTFPARRGDRISIGAFLPGASAVVEGAAMVAGPVRVTVDPAPRSMRFTPGYASGSDPAIVRGRASVLVRRTGPVRVTTCG
jgi:hypothetical protein